MAGWLRIALNTAKQKGSVARDSFVMPLPQLKVLREDHCSQQVVDTAIGWVESHRPELIENLMLYEHWRQQEYSEAAWDVLECLTEAKVVIPTSFIGRMDLVAELTRRGRSAAGLAEIAPSGKPLASGPDQPLPPLVDLEICEHTKEFNHLTQDMADRVLQIAYDERPDLWLAVAEEHRHEVLLDATDQFRALLREIVNAEYPGQDNMWAAMYLYDEGILRIHRMCGISASAPELRKPIE